MKNNPSSSSLHALSPPCVAQGAAPVRVAELDLESVWVESVELVLDCALLCARCFARAALRALRALRAQLAGILLAHLNADEPARDKARDKARGVSHPHGAHPKTAVQPLVPASKSLDAVA